MITLTGEKIRMPKPCVLAVGKFECFHLGHKTLVADMLRLARGGVTGVDKMGALTQKIDGDLTSSDLASALVMFEPHPYRVLSDPNYKPLFTDCERQYLTRKLGVDYLLKFPFSQDFAALPPMDFCRVLFEELQARIVVVGAGYRFGRKREGTVDTLGQMAKVYGAEVHIVALHGHKGEISKTSTSTIRELLLANKLKEAESLLGYPYFIMGEVTPGRQLGRTIGFPTINIYPPAEKFLPADGVYATRTNIDGRWYYGVTNIGLRPTVESGGASRSVETHLLDFKEDELYGRHVHIELLRFIRPERKFESLDALKVQILEDCKTIVSKD